MTKKEPTQFTFTANGHANIQATHHSTFEVTMDSSLTLQGDCIIGVEASASAQYLGSILGDVLRNPTSQIQTRLSVEHITELVKGWGSPHLTLSSATSLVWRTSDYIDDRTIAIRCDKAAKNFSRELVDMLRDPDSTLHITLVVLAGDT